MQHVSPLGSFGRGPFQRAGINGLVVVAPFGLFGLPLVNQVLCHSWKPNKKKNQFVTEKDS